MNIEEISHTEQTLVGKQQLLIKMQLAERSLTSKQQLAVKAGLATRLQNNTETRTNAV